MKRLLICGGVLLLSAGLVFGQTVSPRAVLDTYCVTCHNDRAKTGGLSLQNVDPAHVSQDSEVWEKVVRKLRAGMMPPQGMPRPEPAAYEALTLTLETELDRASALKPK